MTGPGLQVVTGAFGFSGSYIAARLLKAGFRVRTLTNSPERASPLRSRIEVRSYDFDDPTKLTASLEGVETLFNTYWVRFDFEDFTHAQAVQNTKTLFGCAQDAGVRRVVHISITNPDRNSALPYFAGKAELEIALRHSGLSHAILRPAVLFGEEDILIHNIAWMLRRFPVFGVFGDGRYEIQPIHVDDLAGLAVEYARESEDVTVNAIGPETFTFRQLVREVGEAIGCPRPIFGIPPGLGFLAARVVGWFKGDVLLTREEIAGLMESRLAVDSAPTGTTSLRAWMREHADTLGRRYSSELARRRNRRESYQSLRGGDMMGS
jgi:uncharacterized protein YbjT (DUF2867 family)